MSFSFSVQAPAQADLRYADLQRAIGYPVDSVGRLGPGAPVRGLLQLYRPGLTTRAIEVQAGHAYLSVRILSCASLEDHELALAILSAIADQRGSAVARPEDGDPIPLGRLRTRYDARWAAAEIEFGAAAVARMVDADRDTRVTLDGPIRGFVFGRRLLGELRRGLPDTFGSRLVDAMRRTQWPGDCHAASVIGLRSGSAANGIRLAVLTGRTRTLLPDVDAIALQGPEGASLYLPLADLAELLPDHARFLDEVHLLVETIDELQWADLLRAAAPRAIDLDGWESVAVLRHQ
jgi:hypothetical protein